MTYLPTFDDAVAIVAANDAFKHTIEEIDGYRIHTFGYRLPGYQDFMEPIKGNKDINALEIRGLTFVEDNGVYHRYLMLPKFWCLNQTKGVMYNDVKGKTISHITDKLDGSLIRFIVLPNGRIIAKSKGSAIGPHCDMALALLDKNAELKDIVMSGHHVGNATIFEMTGPDNEVVLKYDTPELRVIQVRNELTGKFFSYETMDDPLWVDEVNVTSLDDLIASQATTKGVEGWVVRFTDGSLIKVKTNWYENMHRHFIEKQRGERMYVEMVIDETIDDAIALMDVGDERDKMVDVFEKVSRFFNTTVTDVIAVKNTFTGDIGNKEDKSAFAQRWKDSPNFPLYMFAINNPDDRKIEGHVKASILGKCKNDKDATKFVDTLTF